VIPVPITTAATYCFFQDTGVCKVPPVYQKIVKPIILQLSSQQREYLLKGMIHFRSRHKNSYHILFVSKTSFRQRTYSVYPSTTAILAFKSLILLIAKVASIYTCEQKHQFPIFTTCFTKIHLKVVHQSPLL
jgi:hypothetical protein